MAIFNLAIFSIPRQFTKLHSSPNFPAIRYYSLKMSPSISLPPFLLPSLPPSLPPFPGVAQIIRGSYFGTGNLSVTWTLGWMGCYTHFESHYEIPYSRQTNIAECLGFRSGSVDVTSYSCQNASGVRCIGKYARV